MSPGFKKTISPLTREAASTVTFSFPVQMTAFALIILDKLLRESVAFASWIYPIKAFTKTTNRIMAISMKSPMNPFKAAETIKA